MHIAADRTLAALLQAETYEQIQSAIASLTSELGFRYYGFQYWPGGAEYTDDAFSGIVQCNYPDAWQRRYVDQGYYDDDPVRLYGQDRDGIVEWSLIPRWTSRQELVMQDAARYGLQKGVVSSVRDPNGGRNQVTVTGPAGEGDTWLALQIMPMIVPTMTVCFRRAHTLEEKIKWMTERQRDVFLLLRRGRRREEIAETLSLSVRQVDRHIAHIKDGSYSPVIERKAMHDA